MHETNGNWIKSYIGPVTDEDRLPAIAEMEQALSAHCNLTRPEGPTGMDLELKSEQGVTTVDVHPTLWQIRTDFDPSNPLMFPHRFSTHKTVLQGVIETLIASQRNASGPKKTTGSYLKTCI